MLYAAPVITVYCCALAALFGACMGSFLNCVAWRIVHGESVLRGRSHCDACGHVLSARDLVPVVSYLASGGRCRYCGAKLSTRHVVGEAVSALVFVSLLLTYDISLQTLEAWCVASILLVCSFADLEGYIIPDRFIAVGVVLFIITLFFAPQPLRRALDGAIGGLAVAGCVLLLVLGMEKLLGREAMGVRGIRLREGDYVVGAARARAGKCVLSITEKGYGKRTAVEEYRITGRGGLGIRNYAVTEKTGGVVGIKVVDGSEDLLLVTQAGILIRTAVDNIRVAGRSTQGVIVMRFKEEGDQVISMALTDHEEETAEEVTEESEPQA